MGYLAVWYAMALGGTSGGSDGGVCMEFHWRCVAGSTESLRIFPCMGVVTWAQDMCICNVGVRGCRRELVSVAMAARIQDS
jgi:hypothetical protein